MEFLTRYYAAMYISELWYGEYRDRKSIYCRTRALVLFDRVMAGELDSAITKLT